MPEVGAHTFSPKVKSQKKARECNEITSEKKSIIAKQKRNSTNTPLRNSSLAA
jgi:hypothetical protein